MNRSVKVETSIEIAAAPERIWPYLVDWENLDRWMKEGKDFRVTSKHREGPGVTAVATITIAGVSTKDVIRVTEWEPPLRLGISHLGWVSGAGWMECEPGGQTTLLRWTEHLEPPLGMVGAAGIRLFRPLMQRIFFRDLRLLKELAESG